MNVNWQPVPLVMYVGDTKMVECLAVPHHRTGDRVVIAARAEDGTLFDRTRSGDFVQAHTCPFGRSGCHVCTCLDCGIVGGPICGGVDDPSRGAACRQRRVEQGWIPGLVETTSGR